MAYGCIWVNLHQFSPPQIWMMNKCEYMWMADMVILLVRNVAYTLDTDPTPWTKAPSQRHSVELALRVSFHSPGDLDRRIWEGELLRADFTMAALDFWFQRILESSHRQIESAWLDIYIHIYVYIYMSCNQRSCIILLSQNLNRRCSEPERFFLEPAIGNRNQSLKPFQTVPNRFCT